MRLWNGRRGIPGLAVLGLWLAGAIPAWAGNDPERAQYDLARELSDRAEDGFRDVAMEELVRYDRRFPFGTYLDDVHFRMARLEQARGRESWSAARLLEVLIVDAGSLRAGEAREQLEKLLAKRRFRAIVPRYRQAMERYLDPEASPLGRRLALVRALLLIDDSETHDLLAQEATAYLDLDPSEGVEEVALALGDAERRAGNPARAVAAYERLVHMRPQDPLVSRALFLAAEVLSSDLREHDLARDTYERVARDWPDAAEAASAWLRMGQIDRDRRKQPEIAVRDFDEVLNRYPRHPDAFAAMLEKAETNLEALNDPEIAEQVLLAGVEQFADHPRAPEALERAAHIADRELHATGRAVGHLERLAQRFPAYQGASAALYRAAELTEKDLGDARRALAMYRSLVERYPGSREASRAQRRIDKLSQVETATPSGR